MLTKMEHSPHTGLPLLITSMFLNIMASITRSDVTFVLGTIVSLMAIAHYWIQIRKNTKK